MRGRHTPAEIPEERAEIARFPSCHGKGIRRYPRPPWLATRENMPIFISVPRRINKMLGDCHTRSEKRRLMKDQVDSPSAEKIKWLAEAEHHILRILRERYGDLQLDHTEADLHLGQRLIDDEAFDSEQKLELQCLGVLLGNVFSTQTSMRWATVTNNYGTLLALHDPSIGFTLYPIQMISQRIEDGREVNMPQLYRSFVHDLNLAEQ